MTNRGTALAFLLGAAMGTTVAILTAPASGRETRLRLRRRGEESLDHGREAVQHTKDALRGKVSEIRDQVANVSEAAHSRLDAARNALHEGKAAYRRELGQPVR